MKALDYTSIFRRSMTANPVVFKVFLVTCKNEEDPFNVEGARVVTAFLPLYGDFSRRSREANSAISGRISNSPEILRLSLLPAKMKKIQSKMKALEWSQHFPHYIPMEAFFCHGKQSSDSI